ncbi:two-component response transcriptional regulator [Methylocaldum marinum]|uniref:Two-component response transcriptional regulator n=1 Tax=Methylocaldum marinum TaxID=1432792 RepID=A0A250KXS2_9GAMM|nr:two-component response transcriptional regulator [Methylocaldum marinum]
MSHAPRILIVDDDRELRQLLSGFLARQGFRAEIAADGRAMFKFLDAARFDLVVLDLMLPGEDGLALCRRLRATSNLPVIMLTALAEETDRIVGLEMGADDYVVKPFSPRELLARIKAVLRRTGGTPSGPSDGARTLVFEGWRLNLAKRELHSPEGVLMPLTSGEFDLLAAFAEHPQRVLSRDLLLDLTKGRIAGPYDRSIDVQLSRLRRKIEADPNDPALIKTVRGGGYIFAPPVEREK